ncbi:adenine deaminase [Methanosphaera sp. WGK6]|uniref:adenine deaminase n=1 Tax=Methanosphaera sp. WGK6 TaxID=1561964 RepID=UPI00084CAA44|nr:adenine deaminase [Methanosphaera sp. WGK6]OED30628.1 adenine deaminase [Methanosphaera sp. WGK6]
MIIKGNILNVFTNEIYPGEIEIEQGIIQSIKEVNKDFNDIIVPGFIDSHIHIESSMVTPSRFSEVALKHGTTSIVADPHEIANVMGIDGINYMLEDAKHSPLNYYFSAPSCVPTTKFETSGAEIDSKTIESLLSQPEFVSLGEVMDYNAVINENPEMISKLEIAKKYQKPIDGHAPLLSGKNLQKYIKHGISTDHECTNKKEASEKRRMGMKIMIREGSEAHSLEELIHSDAEFMVTDDLKSEDLIKGHIDYLLRKAVDLGMDPFDAIKLVTINPAEHYNLNTGSITPGKKANLVFIDNLEDFKVNRVIINGNTIFKKQKLLYRANPKAIDTTLKISPKTTADFDLKARNPSHKSATVNVITVKDDSIITGHTQAKLNIEKGNIIPSVFEDILKISVIERYGGNTIINGFVKGFGIKNGAIASSISHDSHNIIAVGTNSKYMAEATNKIIENKGGIVAISNKEKLDLALPIAGLMSNAPVTEVAETSTKLNELVYQMGCYLSSPFTTLSFMALPVVPSLKITNKGLFDVNENKFIDIIKHED